MHSVYFNMIIYVSQYKKNDIFLNAEKFVTLY